VTLVANTRVRVAVDGGAGQDEHGDPIAGGVDPESTTYAAGLTEKSRVVFDETTGDPRTIRWAILRLSPRAPRLKINSLVDDVMTGKSWVVEERIGPARTVFGSREVTFNLKLTDTSE
jgi:hypothetical protein